MGKNVVEEWLGVRGLLQDGFLNIEGPFSPPTEIAFRGKDGWELSFEGRIDEVAHRGKGVENLRKKLGEYGVSIC